MFALAIVSPALRKPSPAPGSAPRMGQYGGRRSDWRLPECPFPLSGRKKRPPPGIGRKASHTCLATGVTPRATTFLRYTPIDAYLGGARSRYVQDGSFDSGMFVIFSPVNNRVDGAPRNPDFASQLQQQLDLSSVERDSSK